MKNILYFIWFVLLMFSFIVLGIRFWKNHRVNKCENFGLHTIDSLFTAHNSVCILTLGYDDCQICNELLNRDFYKDLNEPKCYLDVTRSSTNNLLSQALYAKGFPTTYVINDQYEILGAIRGIRDFQMLLDSILYFQQPVCDVSIHGIDKEQTLALLTDSFQALLNYWRGNSAEMKSITLKSFEKGSYFFNNYLMYLVYKNENKTDSVLLYKNRALRESTHVNSFIYNDLIEELNRIIE